MGALYLVCYFYAIAHIPLADASILAHVAVLRHPLLRAVPRRRIPRGLLAVAGGGARRADDRQAVQLFQLLGIRRGRPAQCGVRRRCLGGDPPTERAAPYLRDRLLLPGGGHPGGHPADVERLRGAGDALREWGCCWPSGSYRYRPGVPNPRLQSRERDHRCGDPLYRHRLQRRLGLAVGARCRTR